MSKALATGVPAITLYRLFLASLFTLLGLSACESDSGGQRQTDTNVGPATVDAGIARADATAPTSTQSQHELIYASIAGSNEVLVIDATNQQVVTHIPVGKGPAIVLATPDFQKLYTANWTDNTVSAVDLGKSSATSIALPGRPYVIAIAPDGKHVYAGLSNNQLAVIDTSSDVVALTFTLPTVPGSIIVSKDSATLYVADVTGGTLSALSAATGVVTKDAIAVGGSPAWITISPDGSKVFTLNYTSDDVAVVDTETFKVIAKVATGAGSKGIIGNVTPDGTKLYVTNLGTGDLIAIDTTSYQIVTRTVLGARPVGVNFSQDGKRVYVTDNGVGSLDTPTSAGLAFLTTGVFTPLRDGQISIFDTATRTMIGAKITVGAGPTSLVVKSP